MLIRYWVGRTMLYWVRLLAWLQILSQPWSHKRYVHVCMHSSTVYTHTYYRHNHDLRPSYNYRKIIYLGVYDTHNIIVVHCCCTLIDLFFQLEMSATSASWLNYRLLYPDVHLAYHLASPFLLKLSLAPGLNLRVPFHEPCLDHHRQSAQAFFLVDTDVLYWRLRSCN